MWPLMLAGGIGGKRLSSYDTAPALNSKLTLIPTAILNRFTPMRLSIGMTPSLRAPIVYSTFQGSDDMKQRINRVSGLSSHVNWNGIYESLMRRIAVVGDWAILHEFGHHVDQSYGAYVDSNLAPLTSREPFVTLWEASRPSIPTYLYGSTNSLEWFAELWTVQLDPAYTGGGGTGSARLFEDLAGGSRARQDSIRAAFVAAFPELPAFTY